MALLDKHYKELTSPLSVQVDDCNNQNQYSQINNEYSSGLIMTVGGIRNKRKTKRHSHVKPDIPDKTESFGKVMTWLKEALVKDEKIQRFTHRQNLGNIEQCPIEPVRSLANEIILEHSVSNIASLTESKCSSWDYNGLRLAEYCNKEHSETDRSESGFEEVEYFIGRFDIALFLFGCVFSLRTIFGIQLNTNLHSKRSKLKERSSLKTKRDRTFDNTFIQM